MDTRLDPAKYAGLGEGGAHVIRKSGGRGWDNAIHSQVISSLTVKDFEGKGHH